MTRKSPSDETKPTKRTFYQQAEFNHEQRNNDNDYLVSKWYGRPMETIKFLFLSDYWGMLERILIENDKQKLK